MASYFANSEFAEAQVVVTGIPLDRTSSFIPGTRFGPEIGRLGTANIESFSPYQKRDLSQCRVYDAGDIFLTYETPDAPFVLIKSTTQKCYQEKKVQLAVGGEHTITPVIISELVKIYPDLCVIQFDAHADLREEFLGEHLCHATAMRRVLDFLPRANLFQLGIRSFVLPEEMTLPNMFPFETLSPSQEVRRTIGHKPVYITLDIDVLDPSIMPDVQTPQPGGCSYRELAQSLASFVGMRIIGADIVEYCPRSSAVPATAPVVAELIRELILLLSY
ncbi:agmatinase [candidate division WOR-3 bacterium]|nr:agmatinase [candidate division WOR-3 bacterium]